MSEFVRILKDDEDVAVILYIENDEIAAIGEQLSQINENAYMNGYNWEALINCYLEKNRPELLGAFESDCEAGMYAVYCENNDEGNRNAESLASLIISLIEDKNKLFDFVREYGDEIEWE